MVNCGNLVQEYIGKYKILFQLTSSSPVSWVATPFGGCNNGVVVSQGSK